MKITAHTRISALIKENVEVIQALAQLNPAFGKLKNPFLRSLLAPRVSIQDACRIAGCELQAFLSSMSDLGFEVDWPAEKETPAEQLTKPSAGLPEMVRGLKVVEMDVRPILAGGKDPLRMIVKKAAEIQSGECLKLLNSFEPVPLYSVLAKKGFSHLTQQTATDEYIVWFVKTARKGNKEKESGNEDLPFSKHSTHNDFQSCLNAYPPDKIRSIDVRHLEMPQPMVQILDALSSLQKDQALFIQHRKVPAYLLPELKERGFMFLIREMASDKVNLLIYHNGISGHS